VVAAQARVELGGRHWQRCVLRVLREREWNNAQRQKGDTETNGFVKVAHGHSSLFAWRTLSLSAVRGGESAGAVFPRDSS